MDSLLSGVVVSDSAQVAHGGSRKLCREDMRRKPPNLQIYWRFLEIITVGGNEEGGKPVYDDDMNVALVSY